ncbi:MAG: N-formylglutamate deformylase [Betaproteobacteria bacterium]
MMQLWDLHRGDSPLIIDVPHAGTELPAALRPRLTPQALAVPDTDWHVDRLYAFARESAITLLCATQSRYVVDLNRDPTGAALYAGADNTELCPTRTFANEPVYVEGAAPTRAEVAARVDAYFTPYHAVLAGEIELIHARYGYVVVLDGHSIRGEVPRFFAGHLPDLNLGTADGASCASQLQRDAANVLGAATTFSHVENGRFKGGYITRHYGKPAQGIHALQLEVAQDCYMDEAPPYRYDEARAADLIAVLCALTVTLQAWRPAR